MTSLKTLPSGVRSKRKESFRSRSKSKMIKSGSMSKDSETKK